ncbi:hypothetical protein HPB47_009021 [Ixodes persulcatus]|uniref:Uncharacterized protein n=1 Tax=Ixodes persulcatus TaxID=34615 RepID=A0AC60P350_IXOPE|nr:hypothetical protein HPB47_009021 [Ixodes persulcatus]
MSTRHRHVTINVSTDTRTLMKFFYVLHKIFGAGRDVRRVPQYAAPREVGCFSVIGEHRDFVNGRDELKYLCMPREPNALSWNLNKGLEDAVWANFDEPERLDRLLRWITENRRERLLRAYSKPTSSGQRLYHRPFEVSLAPEGLLRMEPSATFFRVSTLRKRGREAWPNCGELWLRRTSGYDAADFAATHLAVAPAALAETDVLEFRIKEGGKGVMCLKGLGVNFVCKRGLLSTLACTPYRTRDDWLFSATRYKNTLYLCKFESESHRAWEEQNPQLAKQMHFWGHKFEQYMTSDRPGALPDTSAPLRSGDQFYVVLKGRLGSHSLLFTAEVDAIDNDVSQEPGSTAAYVEFKTARIMTHPNQERNFFG